MIIINIFYLVLWGLIKKIRSEVRAVRADLVIPLLFSPSEWGRRVWAEATLISEWRRRVWPVSVQVCSIVAIPATETYI